MVDQVDADKLLDEWGKSKLEFAAFCAERRVDGRSLRYWQTKLGRPAPPSPVPPAPPIRLMELTTAVVPAPSVRATYRVILGACVVEVDDAFREDTLARLLAVVSAC